MIIAAVAVIAVLVGGYLFLTKSNSGSAGITFSPPEVNCSNPVDWTMTVRLPATVEVGDTITEKFDGTVVGSTQVTVSDVSLRQSDGSWVITDVAKADNVKSTCANGSSGSGVNPAAPGSHLIQYVDSAGNVLAQGSYTVAP
jgi:hypothetical protein